jgi:hypothetical protein
MDGWTITFSPGGWRCNADWELRDGTRRVCDTQIPAGYIVAQHSKYPDERMCLRCMTATVREHLRKKALE